MPIIGALARWGYEWTWSTPRNAEAVDIGANFRLAPGLVDAEASRGIVEFVVDDGEVRRRSRSRSQAGREARGARGARGLTLACTAPPRHG